jgi:hypothetical protein
VVGGVIGIEPVVDRHHPGYAEEELVFEIKRFFVAKVSIRQHTFFFPFASASCGSPDADIKKKIIFSFASFFFPSLLRLAALLTLTRAPSSVSICTHVLEKQVK